MKKYKIQLDISKIMSARPKYFSALQHLPELHGNHFINVIIIPY